MIKSSLSSVNFINVNTIPKIYLSNFTKIFLRICSEYYECILIGAKDQIIPESMVFPFSLDSGIMGKPKEKYLNEYPYPIWDITTKLGIAVGARNRHQCNISLLSLDLGTGKDTLVRGIYKQINGIWFKQMIYV
jgi:hypothetical protein